MGRFALLAVALLVAASGCSVWRAWWLSTEEGDPVPRAWDCERHFVQGCAAVERAIDDHHCGPLDDGGCAALRSQLHAAEARAICDDGSLADCQAACDAGKLRTCARMAIFYDEGVRVPRDDARAEEILARACARGGMEECVGLAVARRGLDPAGAAALAMRACKSPDDHDAMTEGCTLWMSLGESWGYQPGHEERVAGLAQVCIRERQGDVSPGNLQSTGWGLAAYRAGACGLLKDMGIVPDAGPG